MNRIPFWFYRFLHRFKVYLTRRFTRAGLFFLALLVLAAVFGADTTLSTIFQVFTFIAFLLLFAFLFSFKVKSRFEVKRKLPRFATAGLPFYYDVSIKNLFKRPCGNLHVVDEFETVKITLQEVQQLKFSAPRPGMAGNHNQGLSRWSRLLAYKQGASQMAQKQISLGPHEAQDVRLEMLPVRRGRIRLAGINLARTDPLGLCYARKFEHRPQSILVLPKRYALPPIPIPGGRKHHSGGIALTTSVGESEELVSLREYRPGDSLRKFHWKSWAKTGKPIVKEYQEEYFVRHVLILDTFAETSHTEAFEEAVSLAASFACTVQTQESLLDLIFVGHEVYCFTAGRGIGHTDRILEVLADVQPCDSKPFEALFQAVISRAEFCSGCICIFVSWDNQRRKIVQLLRQLDVPVFVLIILEADNRSIPDPGPMSDVVDHFHVLRAGEIERGLGQI